MPHHGKRPRLSLEQNIQDPSETQDLMFAQGSTAKQKAEQEKEVKGKEEEEEGEKANMFSTFASLNLSLVSCTHPSSTALPYSPLTQGDTEEEGPTAGMLSGPQNPQCSYSSISSSTLYEESSRKKKDSVGTSQSSVDSESLWKKRQTKKVKELLKVLILKYRMKEPITQREMLKIVTRAWQKQFPLIFKKAAKYLEVVCGIDIKKTDPMISSSYVLVNSLNLTYEDLLTSDQRIPRNGFLILILGIIFMDKNASSEEKVWDFLNGMGICDGKEHFIYGEPRKFLTRELVQENYLEYQQVPDSHPPRFKFMWGPRAHAETTNMKVLEFFTKITGKSPMDFSSLYAEAFRQDEERAWARAYLLNSVNALLAADHLLKISATQSEELDCSALEENNDDSQ